MPPRNHPKQSLLPAAIASGNTALVRDLLKAGVPLTSTYQDGKTALHLAVEAGQMEVATLLIDLGAPIYAVSKKLGSYSALHMAVDQGNRDMAALLLARGAAVNQQARGTKTPLHIASEKGDKEMVRLLLKHGALVHMLDTQKNSPYYMMKDSADLHEVMANLKFTDTGLEYVEKAASPSPRKAATTPVKVAPSRPTSTSGPSHGLLTPPPSGGLAPGPSDSMPVDYFHVRHSTQPTQSREIVLIDCVDARLTEAIEHISRWHVIALDAEGFTQQGPALLQIAVEGDGRHHPYRQVGVMYVYLFDLLCPAHTVIMSSLAFILARPEIIKVVHDLHQDSWQLYKTYGVYLRSVFDTQLANEFLTGEMFGGLGVVVERYGDGKHTSKHRTKKAMAEDPLLWHRRPLDRERQCYAADDVALLLRAFPVVWDYLGPVYATAILQASQIRCDRAAGSTDQTVNRRPIAYRGPTRALCSLELSVSMGFYCLYPRPLHSERVPDDILAYLPHAFSDRLRQHAHIGYLHEVTLDLGRPPVAVFSLVGGGTETALLGTDMVKVFTQQHLDLILSWLTPHLGPDNRAALDGSLHSISCMRNKKGKIYGLTIRVGRPVFGAAEMLTDILFDGEKSVLIVGAAGTGKTTVARDAARVISQRFPNVCVVDTWSKICGAGNIPHWSVGWARPMMVDDVERQPEILRECYRNHMPGAVVVDQVYRYEDAEALNELGKYRVPLVAGAQGTFRELVSNMHLNGLLGVVAASPHITLEPSVNDPKRCLRRTAYPVFNTIVELNPRSFDQWRVITDVARAVDDILAGRPYRAQIRERCPESGQVTVRLVSVEEDEDAPPVRVVLPTVK